MRKVNLLVVLVTLVCSGNGLSEMERNTLSDDELGVTFNRKSAVDIELSTSQRFVPSVRSSSKSALQATNGNASQVFFSFDIVELKGRPLHETYLPIQGNPTAGPAYGLAELDGPIKSSEFKLLSEAGELLSAILLQIPEGATSDNFYFGQFEVPNQPFKVAAAGVTESDSPFELILDHIYVPQTVHVSISPESIIAGPGALALQLDVTNLAPSNNFQIEVENSLDLPVSVSQSLLELGENESVQLAIELELPRHSVGLLELILRATVTSQSNASISNYAQAQIYSERFQIIANDGFESVNGE